MKHAINELQIKLDIFRNNEPIVREEGNIEQADSLKEKIEDLQETIGFLSVVIDPPYEKPRLNLKDDIEHAINCRSAENGSDTPDFILAEYLCGCLEVWNVAVEKREKWYGREDKTVKDLEIPTINPQDSLYGFGVAVDLVDLKEQGLGNFENSKASDLDKDGDKSALDELTGKISEAGLYDEPTDGINTFYNSLPQLPDEIRNCLIESNYEGVVSVPGIGQEDDPGELDPAKACGFGDEGCTSCQ